MLLRFLSSNSRVDPWTDLPLDMRHLAIETSGQYGSLAYFSGNSMQELEKLPRDKGTVETLAARIRDILQQREPLTFISVAIGPGSFTGLRIGIMTAKMLGMAWEIPVVPVDTLECVAWKCLSETEPSDPLVLPVINAFRGQVFSACLARPSGNEPSEPPQTRLEWLAPTQVADARGWQQDPLGSLGIQETSAFPFALVSGPGAEKYPPLCEQSAGLAVRTAPPSIWEPSAEVVGILGWRDFRAGQGVSAQALEPNYVRSSAAEEKRRTHPS